MQKSGSRLLKHLPLTAVISSQRHKRSPADPIALIKSGAGGILTGCCRGSHGRHLHIWVGHQNRRIEASRDHGLLIVWQRHENFARNEVVGQRAEFQLHGVTGGEGFETGRISWVGFPSFGNLWNSASAHVLGNRQSLAAQFFSWLKM